MDSSYGDKPTFVLTSRDLPRTRDTVKFYSGDLVKFVNEHLRPTVIGDGLPFFEKLDRDIPLHLMEVKSYKSGMVGLRYEVRGHRGDPRKAT